ncbi:MAG: hypothetical protein JWM11_2419 [Planctomycetaceae bacterium]|nr:hypothetical protein [Planctomycetaceae bacterium]
MKLTLLLLWSLASAPLHDVCSTCQSGGVISPGNAGQGGGYGSSAIYGPSSIGQGPASQFNEFSSPCGDINGGYGGGGLGRCNGNGRCRACCKDSTCNMFQHYPYIPDNHGYYNFAPYNYTMVWRHQQWITTIGGDPRNPYTRAMFIPVYEQFENTVYEPDHKPSQTLNTLPSTSKKLPDLEELLKKPDGNIPSSVPTEAVPPAPAPAPPAPGTVPPAAAADVPQPPAESTTVPEPEKSAESAVPDFDKIPNTDN